MEEQSPSGSPHHQPKPRTRSRGSKRSEDQVGTRSKRSEDHASPRPTNFQTPKLRGSASAAGGQGGSAAAAGGQGGANSVHRSAIFNSPRYTKTPGGAGPPSNLLDTPQSNLLNTPRSVLLSGGAPASSVAVTPCRPAADFAGVGGDGHSTPFNSPSNQSARHLSTTPKGTTAGATSQQRSSKSKSASSSTATASSVTGRIQKIFKQLPLVKQFDLRDRIGEGTFSTVYLAARKNRDDVKIALKHLVPTSKPSRILMETNCMQAAAGHPNVIELLSVWRVEADVVLAMPHVAHARFSELIFDMDLEEIRAYVGNLLAALRHIHRLGIIHRDVKPSNFLYNRVQRRYALVDFGLAQLAGEVRPGGPPREDGRGGPKRKMSDAGNSPTTGRAANKRQKVEEGVVLADGDNKLNKSPRARILRDNRGSLRRTNADENSPVIAAGADHDSPAGVGDGGGKTTPPPTVKYIRLSMSPRKRFQLPTRQSPRKHLIKHQQQQQQEQELQANRASTPSSSQDYKSSLKRPSGFSQLRITANSIMGTGTSAAAGSGATPSPATTPTTLARTPSFTVLEPGSYNHSSLATDQLLGFTPLLRASITSLRPASSTKSTPPATSGQASAPAQNQPVCSCERRARVCSGCLELPQMHAPRAGTPGFRPPEVLLKYPNQGTPIDIWAVGVILISILSRSYPFFRAPDDMTALAELMELFGGRNVVGLASLLGRRLLASRDPPPVNLAVLCKDLARRERRNPRGSPDKPPPAAPEHHVTSEGIDLLSGLLALDFRTRLTAEAALRHQYFDGIIIRGD